jgi:membrane protease YdiL (CAAX protease family)
MPHSPTSMTIERDTERPPGRFPRIAMLAAAIAAWWVGDHVVNRWVQQAVGFRRVTDKDLSTILGHWFAWQLPTVVLCVAAWLVGERLGLMPSLRASLGSGGSWRRVARTGLAATAVLLVLTVAIGAAAGGRFGFHPYVPKMIGDLASNLYEELVFRGFLFSAFYGAAAGATFPLRGALSRPGLAAATVGSCILFAAGHTQYPLPLRVVLAVISVVFVWPWVRARSLWAPWVPHTLGDVIGDSILEL